MWPTERRNFNGSPRSMSPGIVKGALKGLIISVLVFNGSCSTVPGLPADVKTIVGNSANKGELLKAFGRFEGDSLKTEALLFLIRNMKDRSSIEYRILSEGGDEIDPDWTRFENYGVAKAFFESRRLAVEPKSVKPDLEAVTSEFLIENIDLAFAVWKRPYSDHVSFHDFCNYILPYRVDDEQISPNWRRDALDRYKWLLDSMENKNDPIEACILINNDLKKRFKFNYRLSLEPASPAYGELLELGEGTCGHMTALAIYTMRALGLAVSRDNIPYWTRVYSFDGHVVNSVLNKDGKWVSFMGAEENPGDHTLAYHFAKIKREAFEAKGPRREREIDVTDQFSKTSDIELASKNCYGGPLFLAVYSKRAWKPVARSSCAGGVFKFSNMAVENIYLPVSIRDNTMSYSGDPIWLSKDKVSGLSGGRAHYDSLNLTMIGINPSLGNDSLKAGKNYSLHYWEGGWIYHSTKKITGGNGAYFHKIPKNTLLGMTQDDEERPLQLFTIDSLKNQAFY